jgi:uncharacterized damage-inducible protein DinB
MEHSLEPTGALVAAAREILAAQKATMREIVSGLSADALNWRPVEGDDSNSIAAMLTHALDAERYHLALGVGVQLERDREAQFRVQAGGADELMALINRVESEVNGYLDLLTSDHLNAHSTAMGESHSGAWRLLHAIEHSREHVGQGLLTRQLWDARRSL